MFLNIIKRILIFKNEEKMKYLIIFIIFCLKLNKLKSETFNCSSLNQYILLLLNPINTKCGVIPGQLLSNKKNNGLFYINWKFNSDHSLTIHFELNNIENYSILSYYYTLRKYASLNESSTNVTKFINNSNSLIFNFNPVSTKHENEYDILPHMYIMCVMIINLNDATIFSLPFMCIDVFVDKNYYNSIHNEASSISTYGVVITLGPLLIILLITIAFLNSKFHKHDIKTSSTTIKELLNMNKTNLLMIDLLKSVNKNENPENKRKFSHISNEISNERKFSRYELIEDCKINPTPDETLFSELNATYKKNSMKPTDLNDIYLISNSDLDNIQSDIREFYV